MVALYVSGMGQVVVSFDGLPGAGKTTVTNGLEQSLVELYGEAMRPITLSTDDYHVGKTGLEARHGAPYTEWDTAKTYDIEQLKLDIAQLEMNLPIMKRHFDFDSEEPVFDGEISSTSPFVIIEGIHAGSSNLNGVRHLHFEMPTGIATSVGRDLRRLVIENRANRVFPTPESRLRYQIETVVPAYFERERPSKKAFSACERPLAERAFMLNALTE
jgi:hypothetical protein